MFDLLCLAGQRWMDELLSFSSYSDSAWLLRPPMKKLPSVLCHTVSMNGRITGLHFFDLFTGIEAEVKP